MLLVCYNLLNSQNIPTYLRINQQHSEKWLVTRILPTQQKKLLKLHRKKSNNQPMVSFSHNGSEIITCMGHSFKTKSIQSNILKITTPFLNLIRLSLRCKFLRFSNALMKICQNPHIIFQTTSEFFLKFYMTLQCHER